MKKILSLFLSAAIFAGSAAAFASASSGAESFALKPDSKLILDSESGYISRIPIGSVKADLISEFEAPEGIEVKKNGNPLGDTDELSSGCTVTVGDISYTCAVTGDTDGKGKININDVTVLLKYIAKWKNLPIHIPAIDANLDGKDNMNDVTRLLKYIAGWNVHVGVFDVVYSNDRLPAKNEDQTLALSVTDNMQKIDQRDTVIGNSATIRMNSAKNEIESAQILLASEAGHKGLSVTFTPFENGIGGSVETELTMHHYVSSEAVLDPDSKVMYPDAMIPVASSFDIKAGYSQGFLLKAKTPKGATPGLYESTVTFYQAGKAVKMCKVYLNVWDFELSDDTACETAFGISRYAIYTKHQQYEADDNVLFTEYYDYLLENRMCAYNTPYAPGEEGFEEYLRDPRVTSFYVEGCQEGNSYTDDELSALYEKYKDDKDWQEKAYFYYVDEPHNEEQCNNAIAYAERLQNLFPGSRNTIPLISNPFYQVSGERIDQIDRLDEIVNLWCPVTSFFTPEGVSSDNPIINYNITQYRYSAESRNKYGTADDRFAAYRERGDDMWWYVCVHPQYPYANVFVNYQGESSRVLFWQQYDYDVEGFLYYMTTLWNGSEWRTADNEFYSGDGLLMYSGKRYDIYGPIGSIRIEYIRDGIEDFEYLTMAEKLCGKEAVDEVLATVTTGILEYTEDSAVIESAKIKLAEMILAAQ